MDKDTDRILAVFVYADDDANISCCTENAFRLAELMDKYLPTKKRTFYSGFASNKDGTRRAKEDNVKYTGKNWLEGMQVPSACRTPNVEFTALC